MLPYSEVSPVDLSPAGLYKKGELGAWEMAKLHLEFDFQNLRKK